MSADLSERFLSLSEEAGKPYEANSSYPQPSDARSAFANFFVGALSVRLRNHPDGEQIWQAALDAAVSCSASSLEHDRAAGYVS